MHGSLSTDTGALILAIAGRIGAGKTTVANYLVQSYGFQRLSYSAMLKDLFRANRDLNCEPTRHDLQELGNLLTNVVGHAGLTAMLMRAIRENRVVVDGVRHYDGYQYLVRQYGRHCRLIFRDLPISLRYRLHNERLGESRTTSFAHFQRMDGHPGEAGTDALEMHADFCLPWFENIAQLHQAVDGIVSTLLSHTSGTDSTAASTYRCR